LYKKHNFNISAFFGFTVGVEFFVQCVWNYECGDKKKLCSSIVQIPRTFDPYLSNLFFRMA